MWNGRNHRSTEHALARYVADAPPEKGNVRGKRKTKKADKIGVGVGIGIGVEKEIGMAFGHEKLDVYRAAIEYVGWAYRFW